MSSNGYLSFSSRSAFGTPVRFPFKHTLASLICPFWANVDPSGIGQVYYRYASGSTAINNEIRKYFSSAAGFRATWVLIATWYNVGYFDRHTDKVRCSYELDPEKAGRNCFQYTNDKKCHMVPCIVYLYTYV